MTHRNPILEEAENIETFLTGLQDYSPPIPDAVIMHILAEAGMNTTDPRVHKTMNIVCQKFINDVLASCARVAKNRAKDEKNKKKKLDLQVCDVKEALRDTANIQIHRPEFIVSIPESD